MLGFNSINAWTKKGAGEKTLAQSPVWCYNQNVKEQKFFVVSDRLGTSRMGRRWVIFNAASSLLMQLCALAHMRRGIFVSLI